MARRAAVRDGERDEHAVHRDGVDGHLRPVDELLDQCDTATGLGLCSLDRRGQAGAVANESQAALTLAIGCLDDAGKRDRRIGRRERLWLQDAGRGKALALTRLRGCQNGSSAVDRMRQAQMLRHTSGDPNRPVGARRDEAVDRARLREPLDGLLVLGRDQSALVCEGKSGGERVTVDCDHLEVTAGGGLEQAELRGARA